MNMSNRLLEFAFKKECRFQNDVECVQKKYKSNRLIDFELGKEQNSKKNAFVLEKEKISYCNRI